MFHDLNRSRDWVLSTRSTGCSQAVSWTTELVYRKRLRRDANDYRRSVPAHVQAARKLERSGKGRPGRWIRYVVTRNGPEPVEALESVPDHDHYLERQLAPAADGVLRFLGTSFADITDAQLGLF